MAKRKTIVIIEDDPRLQQELTLAFVEAEFVVDNAYDGEAGIDLVLVKKPDVVLLDLVLPKKDGFNVLWEIRNNAATSQIPVVVLSNLESAENVEQAVRLGAISYLVKPNYRIEDVVTKIESVLAS